MSAAFIAAVALVVASGAGAAKTRGAPTKIDVSTKAAVVHYLRSIHVNPKGVVIQRGLRNYAGPNCPGKRWTCASTARTVVQIASAGGKNAFRCSAARCAVVQVAAAAAKMNKAVCVKTTGLGASCSINQSSSGTDGNQAIVWEDAGKLTGLNQTALYTASITQKASGSGANTACAHQAINIDGSTGKNNTSAATVALDAHQSIAITQDSASGGNTVEDASQPVNGVPGCVPLPTSCPTSLTSPCGLSQTQTLTSNATSKGSIVQNENKTDGGPNLRLDIKQNQSSGFLGTATGANKAVFTQTNALSAVASTPVGATQWQSSANGGLLAAVNQDSRDVSTSIARQKETQCEDAAPTALSGCVTGSGSADAPSGYPLSQTQIGPMRKAPGDSSQTGNTGDSFTVVQNSQQDNDQHSGQTNVIEGGFHTDGSGTVSQTATIDGHTSTDTQAGTGDVSGSVSCTGSSCTSTPPPPPTITSGPPNPSSSPDATFTFSDADTSATFLCQLDGGGYASCTSPATYSALGPGSHTFSVEAKNPTTGQVSDPTSWTWTISSGNASVLIAGAGDLGPNSEPNDNLAQALTAAGYSVTEATTLPADISSFGQVWWVDATPPTSAEQNQLIAFAQSGKGVYLTGERPCCEDLNAADQTIVDAVVVGGNSITVGGQGDVCFCNSPLPVNPNVIANLGTTPHTVTSWTPDAPGGMTGVPDSSVFSYYQPAPSTKQVVAAAWDRKSTAGEGRLVVFMDINWVEATSRAANWSDVAENVAFFLSGLASPPSAPVILAPATVVPTGPSLLAHATPTRAASVTASTTPSSTR